MTLPEAQSCSMQLLRDKKGVLPQEIKLEQDLEKDGIQGLRDGPSATGGFNIRELLEQPGPYDEGPVHQ